jgi:hypothetical protein
MKTPPMPLLDREFPRESGIQESECGVARSALLLLDSGFWILDSSAGHGVFNGVGASATYFALIAFRIKRRPA